MSAETEEDRLFREWRETFPEKHWSKTDLGACRLGWDAGRRALKLATTAAASWQLIGTAPKTGDHILIARIEDIESGDEFMPEGVIAHWAHFADGWGWYANGIGLLTEGGIYVPGQGRVTDNGWEDLQPTHWLPLMPLQSSKAEADGNKPS